MIMAQASPSETIRAAVSSWSEMSEAPHRFGGVEFKLGTREIGHLHGDRLLDLPFPRKLRDELVASGRAAPHHVLPQSGWVSFRIKSPADTEAAVALLRLSYDTITEQLERRRRQKTGIVNQQSVVSSPRPSDH
jgi:predicted DNA-binding protein (MmcQ/YjbR family)